jgi:IclR family KDG regulon transcriptional repressor
MAHQPYTVQPILKALRLLEGIASKRHDVTLTEVARDFGLPKTTAFRYLHTLVQAGFVRHDAKHDRYGVGPRLAMLAEGERGLAKLRQAARPQMERLANEFNATINLAISSGLDIVYVEMVRGSRFPAIRAKVGEHHPLHSTAVGKAILAFLPPGERSAIIEAPLNEMTTRTIQSRAALRRQLGQMLKTGYSLDREETESGVSCIGVPILDDRNYPIAAMSLATGDRQLMALLDSASRELQRAAEAIRASE